MTIQIILFGMCINHFRSQYINLTRINNNYLQESYLGLPTQSQQFFQISNNYNYSMMKCDQFSGQTKQVECSSSPQCSSCNNNQCQLNYTYFRNNLITDTIVEMTINISLYNKTQVDSYQLDNFFFYCIDKRQYDNQNYKGVLSLKQELFQINTQYNLQFSTINYSIYIGQYDGYIKNNQQDEIIDLTNKHYIRYIDNSKILIDQIQVVNDDFYDVQIQLTEQSQYFFASINTAQYEVYAEKFLARQIHSAFQSSGLDQQKIFYDQMPCYKWDKNVFNKLDQFIHSFQTFNFRLRKNFTFSWIPEVYLTKINDLFCLPVKPLPNDSNVQLILGTSWMIGWEITFDELNGQLILFQKQSDFQIIDDSKNEDEESISPTVIIILSISILIAVLIILFCIKRFQIQKSLQNPKENDNQQPPSNAPSQLQSQLQSQLFSQELTQSRIRSEQPSSKAISSTFVIP